MRIGFFLREALRALSRSAAPSLAAMLTILITALVLGVFIPVVQATTGTADEVRSRVVVDVYVKDGASDAERAALKTRLDAMANVKSVEFIPKEKALEIMSEQNKEAFALLGANPLPDSFRVTPRDPDGVSEIAAALNAPPQLSAVDEVRNRRQDTEKILNATGLVKLVTAGLALLFVLASVALVANTIRLSIFARRREVEVMRLVGATNWFIRWPFVIEGMIVGLMGGALAVLLLLLGKTTFIDPLADRFALLAAPDTISFSLLAAVLLGACVAVSAIGSGVTLRRFLRV
jgi:cell division transport system permease protein